MFVCVFLRSAARDSPVTNGVRHRLNETSAVERWASRDHDLSKSAGRRSALQHLDAARPEHTLFFPPFSGVSSHISSGRGSDTERYIVFSYSLFVHKHLSVGDAQVLSSVCLAR